jgi:hypothetical protein
VGYQSIGKSMITGDTISLGPLLAGIRILGIEAQVSVGRIKINVPAGISSVVFSEAFYDSAERGAISYFIWWNLAYKYSFIRKMGIAKIISRILVELFTMHLYKKGRLYLYFDKVKPAIIKNMMERDFEDTWS